MFVFALPSAALTLDIILEEVDSAPMDDGALLCPTLAVNRCREDLDFFFAYDMFHFWGDVCYCDSPWYRGKLAYRVYPVYGCVDIVVVLGDCIQDWVPGDDGLYPTSPRWLVTRWLALLSPFDMGESE